MQFMRGFHFSIFTLIGCFIICSAHNLPAEQPSASSITALEKESQIKSQGTSTQESTKDKSLISEDKASVDSASPLKSPLRADVNTTESLKKAEGTTSPSTFKKGAVLASSIIVSVYEQGKFVGIVLIDRGRAPLGQALPGGLVRWGETCEECAKRTLVDECGLTTVSNLKQFHVYSDPQRDPRIHVIDTGFTARVDDIKLSAGTDAKRAWVCPIDKISWEKLVFDHRFILRDFVEYSLTRPILFSENILTTDTLSERNKNDYNKIAKQAYRSPVLSTSVILEVYEENEFKGIILIDKNAVSNAAEGSKSNLSIPGGRLEYGETVENAAHRTIHKKCHIQTLKEIRQFKVYFDAESYHFPHNIFVQIARVDIKKNQQQPWFEIYPLNQLPSTRLSKMQNKILQDYLDYRQGKTQMLLIDSQLNPGQ